MQSATQNRLQALFETNQQNLLSIYFTAGYPQLHQTMHIIECLEKSGVDMIEVGMPFSDPLADGPLIQAASQKALENGMNMHLLFEQLQHLRTKVTIPILLMGYLNPVLQYGMEAFCAKCAEIGVDGLILPDLPLDIYTQQYAELFEQNGLCNVLLVTPQTSNERVQQIDTTATGFVYLVSTASTTGGSKQLTDNIEYFERIRSLQLKNPSIIGFNVRDKQSFDTACQYANGAIIGSAFVQMLGSSQQLETDIPAFLNQIRPLQNSKLIVT